MILIGAMCMLLGSYYTHGQYFCSKIWQREWNYGLRPQSLAHYAIAAMAGYKTTRFNLVLMEYSYGETNQAVKHLTIAAASAGIHHAMFNMLTAFKVLVSR